MPPSQAPRLNRLNKTTFDESIDGAQSRRANSLCGAILLFFAGIACRYLGLIEIVPALRSFPYTGIVFLLLGAWLGARNFKIVLALSAAVALLLVVVAYTPLPKKMSELLIMRTPASEISRGADAVVVLGSWVQLDNSLTSPAMSRLLGGIELVRQGHAEVLLLSELQMTSGSYVKAARHLASTLKFPLNVQAVPGLVINTRDEAVHFAALAKSKKWTRVFLVTSPTHTRRATLMFRRAAQGQNLQVLPVPSMELDADIAALNDPIERINVFRWCVREFVGIWIYQRRGWI